MENSLAFWLCENLARMELPAWEITIPCSEQLLQLFLPSREDSS